MSTWRDSLLPASFRGVGFFISSTVVPIGRKGQLHEFPQRDEPYFESLGKQSQVHTVTAFIVGPDCFEQRDKLLQALETPGAGELVHPWLGRMQVQVGDCDMTHSLAEGGIVHLNLKFYPDQPLKFPTSTLNTGRQLVQASEGLLDSALRRYRAVMATVDAVRINIQALRSTLSGVFATIQRQFASFMAIYSDATALVYSLVNAPYTLSTMFSTFFASFQGDSRRSSRESSGNNVGAGGAASGGGSTGSGSGSSGGSNAGGSSGGIYGSAGSVASGSRNASGVESVPYRSIISDATQQAQAVSSINQINQGGGLDTGVTAQATADLVQDALLVKVARVVASMPVAVSTKPILVVPSLDQQRVQPLQRADVPVADDVIELRDTLSAAIWDAALKADPEHYLALNTLRHALISHLNAVAASGVRLQDMKVSEPLPALVLAYRRFGDASRSHEVVQRNRIPHPGFVSPGTLKIAQE
ncbi:DNA circularization N-terminal domain-containing protein [Pseudomonas alliivorans]|uniref:DNA circularization N-terminal domain-containing protein n=1 Tax=Pseudomonas alliivorans TaxID=2810613 RepID=A0ABS4C709_9PSED|nr:DNA circularization N-terminal domain-containing protein [Pseudomonas alliivorans]MBP0946125.1 DNA circularization N-terminal domain-containing protein [Pseudomonas alliivorans]MEE4326650.1 DNA circularization N-terminal domain-containing protein [Pseudomonas alliivorans]MEE4333445.1 DNA circularization N-terminal domain-containing protein [Pseudomonas alliivorans]MEE4368180.1 DNA circularization N-terminal domain-containing protein [Pseudomonas alliivorans]MEE5118062.1 DNA circularization 